MISMARAIGSASRPTASGTRASSAFIRRTISSGESVSIVSEAGFRASVVMRVMLLMLLLVILVTPSILVDLPFLVIGHLSHATRLARHSGARRLLRHGGSRRAD